jgi:hypothetical protein
MLGRIRKVLHGIKSEQVPTLPDFLLHKRALGSYVSAF